MPVAYRRSYFNRQLAYCDTNHVEGMMFEKNVTKVVQDCILDSGIQAKMVAEKINKPYSTLMREINPFDASAKLGAETLLEIMKVTHDIRPLQFMATQMGYSLDNGNA
jgi:predicted transcriptional regulator